jgi:hypothetical protein
MPHSYIKWTAHPTRRNCQIPTTPSLPQTYMAKTHIYQKKTAWFENSPHVLDHMKEDLSLGNKLLIYKTILKPIWTYGIPVWGTGSNSNIEILQRFQNKVLRSIINAPRYVPNTLLHTDLQIPTVKE